MQTIFDLCRPRPDVLKAQMRDEDFAADLSKVVRGNAPAEYGEAGLFFRHTHPTDGLKGLLETVCRRLSGAGGELNSVIRLDTQYGGGKTHSLIALVHAARGLVGVERPEEFVDPSLLPSSAVRLAALDGENSDPANGLRLEEGLFAKSLWGEMAYRLAGREGFERLRESDERMVAPGADTIAELFGGEPALVLIDEVSVYLRKVAQVDKDAVKQFPAFLHALVKAVASTPQTCLVTTLAVRASAHDAKDAYKEEQRLALEAFEEAESVLARQVLDLNPTKDNETIDVLRRRLFESVDDSAAAETIAAYADLWSRNQDSLPQISPELREQFHKGYPFHPETLGVLTDKISSLTNFQRTRGMLRMLSRTVRHLWDERPDDALAIHPHHIDPGYDPIRKEILTKLGQDDYATALKVDVAAVPGSPPSTAQALDRDEFAGGPPVASYTARTIFLNTLAFNDAAQGVTPDRLRLAVASPSIEPSFVEAARKRFVEESLHLDDRPGAPLRLRVAPNLTMLVRKAEKDVDPEELRTELDARARDLFASRGGSFELVAFPAAPYDVPDEIGNGKPFLVLLHHSAYRVTEKQNDLPPDLARMATRAHANEDLRKLRNNVVFLVADERLSEDMRAMVRRRLALHSIVHGERFRDLADYQQRKVKEELEKARTTSSIAILQAYRHLYYPDGSGTGEAKLARTTVELPHAAEAPGNGQVFVKRALRDQRKLLDQGDSPDAPRFVRDQTPLKTRGSLSTAELRHEYRQAPSLSILLSDAPLIQCIRQGIERSDFILRSGDLVWGPGDPAPAIAIDENSFVHTWEDAATKELWPRKAPEEPEVEPNVDGSTSPKSGPGGGEGAVDEGDPKDQPPSTAATFSAEAPLRQALEQIFEQARHASVGALASLSVRLFEDRGAWMVQQAAVSLKEADVSCSFDARMKADGIDRFDTQFEGNLSKATTIKSLIERQLQSAQEKDFEACYRFTFRESLSTDTTTAGDLIAQLTRYGGSEAFVEAHAAPSPGDTPS